jgi:hypothetical protein
MIINTSRVIQHKRKSAIPRSRARPPEGVGLSRCAGVGYQLLSRTSSARHWKIAVCSPGHDACRCRPFAASLLSHRRLAPGAVKKSHINLFFVQRDGFDKLPQRKAAPFSTSLLGAGKKRKRPGEARPFLGFPPLAQHPGASAPEEVSQWGRYPSAGTESLSAQISVRSVSTTCTVTSCPYRSMHALDELQERGRA